MVYPSGQTQLLLDLYSRQGFQVFHRRVTLTQHHLTLVEWSSMNFLKDVTLTYTCGTSFFTHISPGFFSGYVWTLEAMPTYETRQRSYILRHTVRLTKRLSGNSVFCTPGLDCLCRLMRTEDHRCHQKPMQPARHYRFWTECKSFDPANQASNFSCIPPGRPKLTGKLTI